MSLSLLIILPVELAIIGAAGAVAGVVGGILLVGITAMEVVTKFFMFALLATSA